MNNQNNNNVNDLLNQAKQQTGIDPESLKNGNLDNIISKMKPQDAAKFKEILSNPQLMQQMLSSPQAQLLMKKFMK
ncbi:hypothetical protein RBG61_06975 [Paludicola sp. MB14-C6]|uniref:hypothetical protein n=1 Tax=Paludihabitans sp. MB14-C6 TaxID=3070656 RepID=UPI0027DCB7EE|nr:hypothetical protein [Paludicola sp. MB14-C6]WMJ24404.1 hypothetical protein RBG61_06975 [Paludicola sp. MB14-C6]